MPFKRYQPKDGDDLREILMHQEFLLMHANHLLRIVRELAELDEADEEKTIHLIGLSRMTLRELGEL